jgi:hypothetical protein
MCYLLYLGADTELPLIPSPGFESLRESWPHGAPPLIVEPLREEVLAVKRHFPEAHVVYAGSFESCGCGFNRCVVDLGFLNEEEQKEEDELVALSVGSRKALHDYVRDHGVSTLYGCWAGDEELPSEDEREVPLESLADRTFELPERVKMTIRRS